MKAFLALTISALALSAAVPTIAAAGQCPDGTHYDEDKGKCVTNRGS